MQPDGQLAREQLCGKGQAILDGQKLNVGHRCVLAAEKANGILGCTSKSVAQGKVFSDGTCEIPSGALCPRLGSLVQKKTLTCWFESSGEPPRWLWGWNTWHAGRGSGSRVCSA